MVAHDDLISPLGPTPEASPVCDQSGPQETFRATTTWPNQLTQAEYETCLTDQWSCTSFCSDCPAGTFDPGHAVGTDAGCQHVTSGDACIACGAVEAVATTGSGTSAWEYKVGCATNFHSSTTCSWIGRHNCPSGYEPPIRSHEGAYSNACTQCPAGKAAAGGLTAAGTTFKTTLEAKIVPATELELVTLFSHAIPCEPCAAGTYADLAGLGSCKTCGGGASYTDMPGATECLTCGSGSWVDRLLEECVVCPVGYKCTGDGGKSQCQAGLGEYNPEPGQPACQSCTTQLDSAGLTCVACQGDNEWHTGANCVDCPAGSYTSTMVAGRGWTSCTVCPRGSSCDGSSIVTPCPAGKHAGSEGSTECTTCGIGKYALYMAGQSHGAQACESCPIGKFNSDDGVIALMHDGLSSCTSCSAVNINSYNNVMGASECKTCTACASSENKVKAISCSDGVNRVCHCAKGSAGDGATCTKCTGDTYTTVAGLTSCLTCPAGEAGATANYQCTEYSSNQANCGTVAATSVVATTASGTQETTVTCGGGGKVVETDSIVSYTFLTAVDWPPYHCTDVVALAPGNSRCVSDQCNGDFYSKPLNVDVVVASCLVPGTVGEGTCAIECKAGYSSETIVAGTCRGSGTNGHSSPQYMGGQANCVPSACPANTMEITTDMGVVGGCNANAGYAGTVTKTKEAPFMYTSTVAQCPIGKAAAVGQSLCTDCVSGSTFSNVTGTGACLPCTLCTTAFTMSAECTATSDRVCTAIPWAATCGTTTEGVADSPYTCKAGFGYDSSKTAQTSPSDDACCTAVKAEGGDSFPIGAIVALVFVGLALLGLGLFFFFSGGRDDNRDNNREELQAEEEMSEASQKELSEELSENSEFEG